MRRHLPLAVLSAVLLASSAWAQTDAQASAAPALSKDREAVTFNEVERGFFFGLESGVNFILRPPSDNGVRPSSSGELVQLELGADIGPYFSLSAFVRASFQAESAGYEGQSGGAAVGDFSTLTPGVSVRIKPLSFSDSQGVDRTWLYIPAGAGYTLFYPKVLLPNSDILVFAGVGIEYYTRLRHFSIGVEAVGSYLVKSGGFGFAVTPNLRYAF